MTQFLIAFQREKNETCNYLKVITQFNETLFNEFYDFESYFTFL